LTAARILANTGERRFQEHALAATPPGSRLVAVVVTHDRLTQLRATLTRLLASPPDHLAALVVVDNASTDGTADYLAGLIDPRLDVLRLDTNTGGAGGFAAGIARARDRHDPDWTLVMDDDARPSPDALARFHALEHGDWDALAAAVFLPDGRIAPMNIPSCNPFADRRVFWRTLLRGRRGFHLSPDAFAPDAPARRIDGASFVGLFLSRRAVALAGLPDPGLFLYGDDTLYTLTLSARGGRIGFVPALRFEHDCHSLGCGGHIRPLWRLYYYHRNLLLVYRAAAGAFFWPALLLIVPKWLWSAARHPEGGRRALRLMARALRDGLLRRTGVTHTTVRHWADPITRSEECRGDSAP
jgi:GT2 family glycosyltransferase